MSSPSKLTLSQLTEAVAGGAVAIRAVARLEPAGGPADKVFPPTYVKDKQSTTKYAFETRKVDGRDVETVLLDSVASQANRIEESLLEGWRRGCAFRRIDAAAPLKPGSPTPRAVYLRHSAASMRPPRWRPGLPYN